MKEAFLHYIWQHQYFDKTDLCNTSGIPVQVLKTGFYHSDAGPDFKEALVRVGEVKWAGSVEIHLKASDWLRHQHQLDLKYEQVVLHVVWEEDKVITRADGSPIPTLELKNRISEQMLHTYQQLQFAGSTIPCAAFWPRVPEISKVMMLERALTERLEQKGEQVLELLRQNQNDWEQTAYTWLCKGFGFKINQAPFERLSKALPWQVIRKHQHNLLQVEALLFGQAGFLATDSEDDYQQQLQQEYTFFGHKYNLREQALQRHHWNYLRLRPANFPPVRLAQLAAVLAAHQHMFAKLIEAPTLKAYEALFTVPVSVYWQKHYDFQKETKAPQKGMGKGSVHNLIINVAAPLLAAYASYTQDRAYLEKAISLLENVKEATNHITRQYEELGWQARTAADNQAALGLYHLYCAPVNCLRCAIGNKILKHSPAAA